MSAALVERWIVSRRAAEARERRELREAGADTELSICQALDLIALADAARLAAA